MRVRFLLLALAGFRCGGSGSGTADGMGDQDATAALEQAIDEAEGGMVTLAAGGKYLVRSVRVKRAGITIVCSGGTPATIQLHPLAAGDDSPIFDVRGDDFTIENCILDGNRSAQPPGGFRDSYQGRAFRSAIRMDGAYHGLNVRNVTFRNVYGAAIATRNVSDISVTHSTFEDGNFEAVFADNAFPLGDPQGFLTGFAFTGNTVVRAASHDSSVNANGLLVHQMSDLRIEGNVWTGYERSAIKLENCRSGTVAGNRIRDGSIPNFAAIGLQNGGRELTIRENDIGNVGAGIDTSLVAGGQYPPDELVDLTIDGNTIRDVKPGDLPDGIRILGYGSTTSGITIAGNTIEDVPGSGITLRQFRSFHPAPVFSGIVIRDNVLINAGPCTDFFAGSPVPPTDVTSSGNRCN